MHCTGLPHKIKRIVATYALQIRVELESCCHASQNWRNTAAKEAFGHLREFASAHTQVLEMGQGNVATERTEREHVLDTALRHLKQYGCIIEQVCR